MNIASTQQFVRDRFTWLAYLMLGYYAYLQATLGPASPFLRAELNLNYVVTGLHVSAFALGMVLAGLTGERAAKRWGRRATFWGGAAGMAVGAFLVTLGHSAPITVGCSFVMGFLGSYLLVMLQAALADHHGEQRGIPLTEANVVASLTSGLAPLFIGALETLRIGWRGALIVPAVAIFYVIWRFSRDPIPEQPHAEADRPAGVSGPAPALPRIFWLYWLIVFFSVAVEWCTIFWGADFLEKVVGLRKIDAATLMSVFFLAGFTGRYIGSRLVHLVDSFRLLLAALALALLGFLCFWLAPIALLNIVGLFLTGLGVGNLYPLTLTVATNLIPNQANVASSRISSASGLAILLVPPLLGGLADQVGINAAYSIVTVLLIAAGAMAFAAYRHSVSHARVATAETQHT